MAQTDHPALAHVDGWGITAPNPDTAISIAISKARERKAFTLFTLNLDHLVKLRTNAAFREAYRAADIVTADGWPVAWAARWQNRTVERATGADMLLPLLNAAAHSQLPVFLFGSSPQSLAEAQRKLENDTDGLIDIVGALAPSQSFDPESAEADDAIVRIGRSGACLCIVALGAPKQEIFAERARAQGLSCGMICVGAAIDFIAGTQTRAPAALRRSGLEWLWRLITNPRRLARRYADCAKLFAELLLTPRQGIAKERI
jgi:exopolysaccharide biosynthesis WecB/TagA/CpsF family protein